MQRYLFGHVGAIRRSRRRSPNKHSAERANRLLEKISYSARHTVSTPTHSSDTCIVLVAKLNIHNYRKHNTLLAFLH